MPAKALFWGAVWGVGEATLGHLLHLAHVPGLPGLVMAPFAVVIMGRLAVRSRGAGAIAVAGVVAASFKLLDLLVPGTDLLALSRPIQAILLEALAGAIWVKLRMGTLLFFENVHFLKTETSPFPGRHPARTIGKP
ncbi:MAG TPA: hypothetical protein VKT17_04100 [Acidobacteriota bacterium]|nr:hypothetical protein [Acidobacteriota bacterium]